MPCDSIISALRIVIENNSVTVGNITLPRYLYQVVEAMANIKYSNYSLYFFFKNDLKISRRTIREIRQVLKV